MSRRFKSSTFKFNQPLSSPASTSVYYCYGVHGKGYGGSPPFDASIRILWLSERGDVKWVDGFYSFIHRFTCECMRGVKGWTMLGWVMADGSLPLGGLDRIDPAMAQTGYLRLIDSRDCTWRQFGEKD
jgi:hypothetical protein